jgi:hypothetical protein
MEERQKLVAVVSPQATADLSIHASEPDAPTAVMEEVWVDKLIGTSNGKLFTY